MHGNVDVSVRHAVDDSSFDHWVGHIRDQHTMRSCRATRMCSGMLQFSTRRAPMIISTTDGRRSRSASAAAAATVTRCTLHNVAAHPEGSRRTYNTSGLAHEPFPLLEAPSHETRSTYTANGNKAAAREAS